MLSAIRLGAHPPKAPCDIAEDAFRNKGHDTELQAAATFISATGTSQTESHGRKQAAAAQHPQTLAAAAPQFQSHVKMRRATQTCVMSTHAAATNDGANGSALQHERGDAMHLRTRVRSSQASPLLHEAQRVHRASCGCCRCAC
jgi:hypothetical protein